MASVVMWAQRHCSKGSWNIGITNEILLFPGQNSKACSFVVGPGSSFGRLLSPFLPGATISRPQSYRNTKVSPRVAVRIDVSLAKEYSK